MQTELFIGATITGFLILLIGLITKKFPPKKINHLYGYRTRRSKLNQQIWVYANKLGTKMLIYLGSILILIGSISFIITPRYSPMISIIALFLGIGFGVYWCETELNKRFDKNGNPK